MVRFSIMVLMLWRSACEADVDHADQAQHISPKLEPTSSKKFFGRDYPHDKKPEANKYYVFDHPYPAVQDTDDFDKDYVKDENTDGGKWRAQMQYDKLRSQINEERKKLAALEKGEYNALQDVQEAKEKEAEAELATEKAEIATGTAKKALGDAQQEVDKIRGAHGDAVDEVNDEMTDLEGCKKKVQQAKKKLEEALKEEQKMQEKLEQEQKELEKRKAAERKRKEEMVGKAEDNEDDAISEVKKTSEALEEQKEEHEEVLKSYEAELKDVKKTEDALARAAEKLRRVREGQIDDDGGVYFKKTRSGAPTRSPGSIALLFAVAIAFLSGTTCIE